MSKDNKRKWEIEYESLKDKNIDQEIKKLNAKIKRLSGKEIEGTNPQEYRKNKLENDKKISDLQNEVERLGKLKENLPQVERTVRFRDAQMQRLEKLNQGKKDYEASLQETKKLSDEAKKLEDELAKLREQEAKINEALKAPNLSDENRKKLEQAKIQNTQKQTQNHNDFSDNQKKLSLKLNNPLPKRDFDKEIQATRNMISKSNFICRNLMQGKKMEEISVDLKAWKDSRFTDKSNETQAKKENSKPEGSKEEQKFAEVEQGVQQQIANEEVEKGTEQQVAAEEVEDNKPVKVSEFDEKHPRLAKIKNFFKNAYSTVVEKISGFRKKDVLEENKPEKEEKANTETEKTEETGKETEKTEETGKETEKTEETKKEPEGKLTSEQVADRKTEFYKRLTETGKLSQLPDNSKLAESMKQMDETKKVIDEGR